MQICTCDSAMDYVSDMKEHNRGRSLKANQTMYLETVEAHIITKGKSNLIRH